jgi:ketosteroid isomerase-like protein
MSQENVEQAKRSYAVLGQAFAAGDLTRVKHLVDERFDPDVVFRPAGVLPESQEVYGRRGALRFLATQMEAFGEMWLEPLEFIDAGDRVVVPVRLGGRARHTEIALEFERVHVWTHQAGKVVRLEIYATKKEALEAAGLSE